MVLNELTAKFKDSSIKSGGLFVKKTLSSFIIFTFAAFLFTSCSNLISEKVTDASFVCDSNFTSVVRSAINVPNTENITIRFEFTGAYQKTVEQTVPINNLEGSKFEFAGIPLNKAFDIYIAVLWNGELLFEGSQENVKISSSNPNLELSIVLKKLLNTKYVLYKYDTDNSDYYYYLTNSPGDTLPNTATVSTTGYPNPSSFTFDSEGNFYLLKDYNDETSTIYSDNKIYNGTEITINDIELIDIAIDRAKNVFYGFSEEDMTLDVYKFPNLISTGNTDYSHVTVNFENLESFWHYCYTVNDGILYDVGSAYDDEEEESYLYLVTVNLNDENGYYNTAENKINLTKELSLTNPDNMTVTDILYQDGAVYILLRWAGSYAEYEPTKNYFLSRGALVKYDCNGDTVSKLGFADGDSNTLLNTSIEFMHVYKQSGEHLYKDNELSNPFLMEGLKNLTSNSICNSVFPTVYAPNVKNANEATALSQNLFYGPQKFIAIKPKKLVIADDGYAFYIDSADNALAFKNVNRVVEVDLESFAITGSKTAAVNFNGDDSTKSIDVSAADGSFYFKGSVYYNSNGKSTSDQIDGVSIYIGVPAQDD